MTDLPYPRPNFNTGMGSDDRDSLRGNVACRRAGPSDGPALFMLHGFPGYWQAWKHYIEPFATAAGGRLRGIG